MNAALKPSIVLRMMFRHQHVHLQYKMISTRLESTLSSVMSFPESQKSFRIGSIQTIAQCDEAFELLTKAAKRGDNVGISEFPDIGDFEQILNNHSRTLTLSNLESNRIEGFIIVEPCPQVRSVNPTVCTLHMITTAELSHPTFLQDLARLAETFVRERCKLYRACVTNVFMPCVNRLLAMRRHGFAINACVPEAGELAGMGQLVGNYMLYKEIGVSNMVAAAGNESEYVAPNRELSSYEEFVPHFKTAPSWPYTYVTSDGIEMRVRAMDLSETKPYYDLLRKDIDKSNGYGIDELPDQSYFDRKYLDRSYAFTIELNSNRKTVAYANLCRSTHQRSVKPLLSDGNISILPEFRNRRWSVGMLEILMRTSNELGFRVLQGDTAVTNLASLYGMCRFGEVVGTLPRGIRFKNLEWIDLLLIRCYLRTPRQMTLRDRTSEITSNSKL